MNILAEQRVSSEGLWGGTELTQGGTMPYKNKKKEIGVEKSGVFFIEFDARTAHMLGISHGFYE